MALVHYDMEGGTHNTAATSALTGAQIMVNPSLEGSYTFHTGAKNSGTLGIRTVAGPTQDMFSRWPAAAPNYRAGYAFSFRANNLPASQVLLATLRHDAGIIWRISLRNTGGLYIDGSTVTGDTFTGITISTGVMYRIEAVIDVINGTARVIGYEGNGLTPVAPEHFREDMNLGSEQITAGDIHVTRTLSIDFDDVRIADGVTSFIGPPLPTKDPSSTVRPWDMVANPGAYSSVGTTDAAVALADESDATYVQSINSPVGTRMMFAIDPLTLGPVTVTVRHNATVPSPTITRTIRLLQGEQLIAQRAVTLPTSITNYSFTTTTSETNQMEWPRNNLYLEFVDSAL